MNSRRPFLAALGAGTFAAQFTSLALAQPVKLARIGLLGLGSASANSDFATAVVASLHDLGYVQGKNLIIEPRWADGKNERLQELAAELARIKVDVIVTFQTPASLAAKLATNTIPVVMAPAADPVASGLVISLARPGSNITGLSGAVSDLAAKNLELIHEILPSAKRIGVLANATDTYTKTFLEHIQQAGQKLGITVLAFNVRGENEYDTAYADMSKAQVSAAIVQPSLVQRPAADLALKHRIPTASPFRGYSDAGGMLTYLGNTAELYPRVAIYVDKLLKGAKPADLPIEQPTKFDLTINLKTAKALGIKIPQSVLFRADKVIE
jgi:putative ABC transport system substrate-binding protein